MADPQSPIRCTACGATGSPGVWWCPQCYEDLRPVAPAAQEVDEDTVQLPVQRRTDAVAADPGTIRAAYRLSKASALEVAMAGDSREKASAMADVEAVADELLAELAAEQAPVAALRVRSARDRILLGVGAGVVMTLLLLGLLMVGGLLTGLA